MTLLQVGRDSFNVFLLPFGLFVLETYVDVFTKICFKKSQLLFKRRHKGMHVFIFLGLFPKWKKNEKMFIVLAIDVPVICFNTIRKQKTRAFFLLPSCFMYDASPTVKDSYCK